MKTNFLKMIIWVSTLAISTNGWAQWEIVYQNLNSSTEFTTIERANKDTLLFSGPFATTGINYTNGIGGWYTVPTSRGFYEMSFAKASKIGYGAGAVDVGLFKTTDGGKTWFNINRPSITSMSQVATINDNKVFFAGAGSLWRSDNGGVSVYEVSNISPALSGLVMGLEFPTETAGYLLDDNGILWKTNNGGNSWNKISEISAYITGLIFLDETTGFIAAGNGIYKTIDGGLNWKLFRSPTNYDIVYCVHFYDSNNGIAAGRKGLILTTQDGGETWKQSESGSDIDLHAALMVSPDFALVVGDKFTVLKNENVNMTTAIDKEIVTSMISVFPNPFTDAASIQLDGIDKTIVVKIYDYLGALVATKELSASDAVISLSNLHKGVFTCVFLDGNAVLKIEKLVKH